MRLLGVLAAVAALGAGPAAQAAAAVAAMAPLPTMTPAEQAAHASWNVRAALNVAALQCQFSPFLATVRNYNQLIAHHDIELKRVHDALLGHFRRLSKATGMRDFDQYTTRTYNGFSTLDAQRSFCDAAAIVGRNALRLRKGEFAGFSASALPQLRASLVASADPLFAVNRAWVSVPDFGRCLDARGKLRKRCPA